MSATPWFKPTGVLDPEKHGTFIKRRLALAIDANIPVEALWESLPAISDKEVWWLENYKQHRSEGYCGLLVTGEEPVIDMLSRVGAMAGCLNRNFVRARVFPIAAVLASVEKEPITASCLLIPDFVVSKADDKKPLPAWRIQQLTALLTQRWSESGLQTVLCAPSVAAISKEYGSYIASLIKNHYYQAEVA
jgi:hypothetical protein